jgi:PAS domain S-box-containing protein
VLVVDDDVITREGLGKLLRGEGFEVQLAGDGEAALRVASETHLDAVLTDLCMPTISGVDLCERLRALEPELPVILLAGRADVDSVVRAMRAGARDYLTKPVQWESVLSSVLEAIEYREQRGSLGRPSTVRARLAHVARDIRMVNERLVESSLRDRELAADASREQAQLEALLANLREGVIVAEKGGRIRLMNGAALRILGMEGRSPESLEELYAVGLHGLDGALIPSCERPIARAFRGERFVDLEVVRILGSGERRRLFMSGTSVQDEDGQVELAIVVLRDVTRLKDLERQREEFMALISHDLRTPLSSVRLLSWTIRHGLVNGADPAALADLASRIESNVSSMNGMVDEILDASQLEAGTFELERSVVDLRALVEGSVQRLDDDRAHRVVIEAEGEDHFVLADEARLDRALTNIVTNALKYSPGDREVRVQIRLRASSVEVTVVDRGIGIPPEELTRLFDRYYRATNGRKKAGFGLGLYIAKLVVEAHGGSIEVESAPGKGTSFVLAFPLHARVS